MIEAALQAGDIFTWKNYPLYMNEFKIPAGTGGLVTDSILDLTAFFERIPESLLNSYKADIEKKGAFDQDYVNKLVNHLKKDKYIPPIVKKDIYSYLRVAKFVVNA
jgi:hypothetical protein